MRVELRHVKCLQLVTQGVRVWTVTLTKPLKKGESEEAHYVFYIVH